MTPAGAAAGGRPLVITEVASAKAQVGPGASGSTRAGRRTLPIAGLTPLSSCDWPGRLVATLFLQGCPWRCSYCHNPELIAFGVPADPIAWGDVESLLRRRRGLLDGVVFSGGEPTAQPGLPDALAAVRELGFDAGLHTGGAYPRRLAGLLPLVDWVGLDVKGLPGEYERVTGVASASGRVAESLDLVLRSGVAFEVRITVDPRVHTADGVEALVADLRGRGVRTIVLQQVREGDRPVLPACSVFDSPPPGVILRGT